ncbi:MAG TPA: phosphate regulon sensor histidine kinase PhoR [Burkholderiaceae bacterium]|jgi:two-component system phosphate regulon sensor histidine kinase PhoR
MSDTLHWLLPRLLFSLLAALVGAVVCWWTWHLLPMPIFTAAIGAVTAVWVMVLFDAFRARRLLAWLRGPMAIGAPRDAGLYGEMAYRIEKAVRERDRTILREQDRLEQFLTAVDASPNGVLLLDANDQIEWCSRIAAEHFSLDAQRDLRQRVTNLVRSPSFVSYLQAGVFKDPLVMQNARGPGLTLAVFVREYAEGMRLVISQDITERERADAMRRDFVANVSHEIRTPLTVLAGFIETMSSLPLTEAERRRVFTLMQQQTNRMQTLVADLLTLAQLEGSPRPAPDQWVSLDALLQRIAADASALSSGRHRIETQADTHVELAGREAELLSAVSNLVNNAVRYTPADGEIKVRWRQLPDGAGELSVSDSGIGIAREHLPRLTERFYRVDGSRSRETGGTGLGLSIVKHVVQRHCGELQVQSEPGQGSTFKLILPAVRVRLQHEAALGVEAATPTV